MKVLKAPTHFLLEDHKQSGFGIEVNFVSRNSKGELINGTTNEEVIEMMIHRLYKLQEQAYSSEIDVCITLLKGVKKLLNLYIKTKATRIHNRKRNNGKDMEAAA